MSKVTASLKKTVALSPFVSVDITRRASVPVGPDRFSKYGAQDVKTAMRLAQAITSGEWETSDLMPGDVRMDAETYRLVRLIGSHYTEKELADIDDRWEMPWQVEDLISGAVYARLEHKLSDKAYNEMEVLAWMAEEHPDVEIAGD
jgi:DNA-binding CsgD family transcriptional regulator